jgi:hypothetical protein
MLLYGEAVSKKSLPYDFLSQGEILSDAEL